MSHEVQKKVYLMRLSYLASTLLALIWIRGDRYRQMKLQKLLSGFFTRAGSAEEHRHRNNPDVSFVVPGIRNWSIWKKRWSHHG